MQGLKIFQSAYVDHSKFNITSMKGTKEQLENMVMFSAIEKVLVVNYLII